MAIINLDDLKLDTAEGRKQAEQRLKERGKQILIDAFCQVNDEDLSEDADRIQDQIDGLGDLLENVNRFEKALERPELSIIDWNNIPDVDREWLIPQWLPANTVTMFTGAGGAGKSWLTLQAVCQIACGYKDAFLNPDYVIEPPADYDDEAMGPANVIFATYEDEPAEIKRRLYALASGMPWIEQSMDAIKRHVHIVDMRGVGSVWGPGLGKHIANTGDLLQAGEDLRAICELKEAKLLVMDPLSGAFGGNENDRTAVYDFVSSFRGWGDEAKCAMLVIGHLPKGEEAKKSGFSGSTAWEASARAMWKLEKKLFTVTEGNKQIKRRFWGVEHTKSNYAALQGTIPLIKQKTGWFRRGATREDAADGYDEYQASITPSEGREKENTDVARNSQYM